MSDDLTDTWHGRFSFPRLHDPISFIATIQQTGEWLSGSVEEPGMRGLATGKVLSATIFGKVSSGAVTFLKTYDAEIAGYDAVHYEGLVGDQGLEISGTWTIPGNWSGSFIMIQSRGLEIACEAHEVEKV